MSAKSKNISSNTSASKMCLITIKICMVILLGLSLSAFATPLVWEPEWSAIVVPIAQSPATTHQSRLTSQTKDFRRWNHSKDGKTGRTVIGAPRLFSTCSGFSCRDMNRNVEDRHDKNGLGQNHQETKQCGDNHCEKKRCGGKNQQNKPCGKNQHQKPCGKNQCKKHCGKNQGKKHCGEKRNGQSRHDTTNCNRQNKRKNNNMQNKRRQFVVGNQVIINVNDGRIPDSTIINVDDGRTTGPTLLPRIETTVAAAQVSIMPQSVGHRSCSRFYNFWYSDIIWLCLLVICIGITFCIYKVYFIADRYHSIIY